MREKKNIADAIELLSANLSNIARVSEWAELMGYDCPKKFARKFLHYYSIRPQKILEYVRLKSIARQLREGECKNFEIARNHGIADEIALNKFVNYHIGCSPRDLKKMPDRMVKKRLEKLIKNGVVKRVEKFGSKVW